MRSLDDLPADQRAVLQMVLQRGRSYEDIATVLSIDRSAVRQRALDACDALPPDAVEPGPERALVTDYLLSQLPEQVADQVYVYLEAADDDRAWAYSVAAALAPLAARPLPELPVAAPLRSDGPNGDGDPLYQEPYGEPYHEAYVEPERPAPAPAQVTPAPASPAAAPVRRERASAGPKDLRRRTAALLGVIAAIVVVVVAIVLISGGSSASKPSATRTTPPATTTVVSTPTQTKGSATTTTSGGPQILAAINLTSPVGATQTLGVAQVVRDDGVVGIVIDAQGVPANSAHNAYALWLYNSPTSHKFVGFDPNLVGTDGKLAIEGKLPAGAAHFKHLEITLETQQYPKTPGEVILYGPFRER
jgi:hypothetical protein